MKEWCSKMFVGKYNKSLIITYIGVGFAIAGMNYALGIDLRMAMICLIIAGVCDLFDGKVARMCKRTEEEKLFGIEIDSLADMVGFVVFPIIIGYSMGLNNWYNILGYILFVLCGITRLGFFNISVVDTNRDKPVSISLIWFLCELIAKASFSCIYPFITYIVAFLFVFNFNIPKFKGKAYIVVSLLAVLAILLMIFI